MEEEASFQSSTAAAAYHNEGDYHRHPSTLNQYSASKTSNKVLRKLEGNSAHSAVNSSFLNQQRQSHSNSSQIIKTVRQFRCDIYFQTSQSKISPYENSAAKDKTNYNTSLVTNSASTRGGQFGGGVNFDEVVVNGGQQTRQSMVMNSRIHHGHSKLNNLDDLPTDKRQRHHQQDKMRANLTSADASRQLYSNKINGESLAGWLTD